MHYLKDPQAVLDYTVDWSSWLPSGDTIVTSTWTAQTGITIDSNSFTTTAATVWLSGGTLDASYNVVNHIVTDDGRAEDQTLVIKIESR
jgi:hypothetical protein